MEEKTKQWMKVLKAALLLGVLGDALLRATPWGFNVLLWAGCLGVALVVLLKGFSRHALMRETRWLLITFILSAALVAWRDSLMLNFLALTAMLISLALIAWRASACGVWLAGVTEYISGIMLAGLRAVFAGFPFLLRDVKWKKISCAGWSPHARAVMRGVCIALPLLFLFGFLFIAADAVFESFFTSAFPLKFDEVFSHIALALAFTWLSGGFLRVVLLKREDAPRCEDNASVAGREHAGNSVTGGDIDSNTASLRSFAPSLGIVEIGVALSLLNALFLCFVLVQLRYLFGGAALVQVSSELTYAQYARRGFFELVAVAALVMPLLLIAHWLLRNETPAHERIFRWLAGAQVALLFVIMVSALRRMLLYQSEYGLTELRLYTTAFMGWLALLFVWFILTVLRGRRAHFSYGALVAGFLAILTLHVINPDALIVRANVAHAQMGRAFDARYAASLSADAAPVLIESMPLLKQHDQCIIARSILDKREFAEDADWRTWNRARSQAHAFTRAHIQSLQAITCPQPVSQTVNESKPEAEGVETAHLDLTEGKSLILKRQYRKATFPAQYDRSLVLVKDGATVAEHMLSPDIQGKSRIDVFKISDSIYTFKDAYNTTHVVATHMLVTDQRNSQEQAAGRFMGYFDADQSKIWRFIPAAKPERKRAGEHGAKRRIVMRRK